MSQHHVIVGAGAVGTATAGILADRGERVSMISRRGSGPRRENVELVATDATDAARLTELTSGAVALYNCANPAYHQWLTDWPPLHAALLAAAERTGATLVTMSNLYLYGPESGPHSSADPMTADTPLSATHPKLKMRGDMWRSALALHEAGRIRMTEVRASDYIEANGILPLTLGKPLLAGHRAYSIAPLDVEHSWTSIADVATALVTVADDERAWGKAWIAPTAPAMTVRELATRFTEANGLPAAKLTYLPYAVLWSLGLFTPMIKELRTTHYQFAKPFVVDSAATTDAFGIKPRAMDESLRAAAANLRAA